MTDHEARAALPLTPEEEAALRERARNNGRFVAGDGDIGVRVFSARDINALLATLDAERGVRVTGDAGLGAAVERWLHAREYERMDAEGAVAALLGYEWDDTLGDGEWVKSAALTGDTPEAPTGDAGLDVERLAEALSMPGVFEDQPDDVDGLAADIAREYAALTGDTPEAQP